MALLEQSEILKIAEGLNDTFPKCSIKDICTIEEYLFNCKLGKAFYEQLKKAECNYTCTPYKKGGCQKGDVVTYRGVKKIALKNTDSLPSSQDWENAPKFCGEDAECLNTFWCNYLMPYLAWSVIHDRAYAMGSRFDDVGQHVKVYNAENSVPASDKDLSLKMKFYTRQVQMSFENMKAYAEGKECLNLFMKKESSKCCSKQKKKSGRKFF